MISICNIWILVVFNTYFAMGWLFSLTWQLLIGHCSFSSQINFSLVSVWFSRKSLSDEDELRRVMDELDSDHDGFIFLTEFTAFCRSSSEDGGASELRDAFKLYDQDQNGLISASELHLVLNRLGMKCSVEDCHWMIRFVNSDGDGNVNFDEF